MKRSCVQRIAREERRRGIAAVELAILLPLLVFIAMASVDFARLIYALVTLQNCARNGALYEFYKASGFSTPYAQLSSTTSPSTAALQADQGNLSVTGSASSPASNSNNYVTVTANATFVPIAYPALHGLPAIPGTINLSQTCSMPFPNSASAVP